VEDDDDLTADDPDLEALKLERAIGLAQALLAPCDFECAPASLDRLRTVLREQYNEGFTDLVLKLIAHYRPPISSRQQ